MNDLHLKALECDDNQSSPCIDAGSPDIDDQSLNCALGLGNVISDMGAYGGDNSGWDRTTGIDEPPLARNIMLLQNYPNPFNARTTIEYDLPETGFVHLSILNILGQKTAVLFSGIGKAGKHRAIWDAQSLPSGMYFASLRTAGRSVVVKMTLVK